MVWTQCINPFGHVPQLPKALPLQKSFGELSPALKPWASELPRDEICFKNPTFWLRRLGMVLVDRCWNLIVDIFLSFLWFFVFRFLGFVGQALGRFECWRRMKPLRWEAFECFEELALWMRCNVGLRCLKAQRSSSQSQWNVWRTGKFRKFGIANEKRLIIYQNLSYRFTENQWWFLNSENPREHRR